MNNFNSSSIDVITDYLLVGSVTAMILVVLAWVIIKVGRIKAPVYRHMIWLYSLTGIAILPLIWLHGPKLRVAVLNTRAESVKVTSPAFGEKTIYRLHQFSQLGLLPAEL